ncbi:MAG: GNAT family N-acetyltransferase [Armatimonadota bacterium]
MIRLAVIDDLDFLLEHDQHIQRELMKCKILDSQVYIATTEADGIVGWLRYGLFWDEIPFMNMLYFLEQHRRKGLGRQVVKQWEEDMRQLGYHMVLTSTQSNEDGQHFYRRLGYVDSGVLLLPNEPAEIILQKDLA